AGGSDAVKAALAELLREPWRAGRAAAPLAVAPATLAAALDLAERCRVAPLVASRLLARGGLDEATRARAFEVRASVSLRRAAALRRLEAIVAALDAAGVEAA